MPSDPSVVTVHGSGGPPLALWRSSAEDIAPTVTAVSLASSVVVYVAWYAEAPTLAASFGTPTAAQVIRVATLSVVVSGLVTAPRGMSRPTPFYTARAAASSSPSAASCTRITPGSNARTSAASGIAGSRTDVPTAWTW